MYPTPGKHLFVTFDLLPFHWGYLLLTDLLLFSCPYVLNLRWWGCGLSLWTAAPFFFSLELQLLWQTGCQHWARVSHCLHRPTPGSFNPLLSSSDLRNQPYRRADAVRRSVRRRFDDQNLRPMNNGEVVMWGRGGGQRMWSEKVTGMKCQEGETGG